MVEDGFYGKVDWALEAKLNDRLNLFARFKKLKRRKWCAKCGGYGTKYHRHWECDE